MEQMDPRILPSAGVIGDSKKSLLIINPCVWSIGAAAVYATNIRAMAQPYIGWVAAAARGQSSFSSDILNFLTK